MISLESAASIPNEIVRLIQPLQQELMQYRYIDSVARTRKAQTALSTITDYLEGKGIIGIHYTRAVPGDISANGLICCTGAQRRALFLKKYGHLFSDSELEDIKTAWEKFFKQGQNSVRDNRVYFTLTTKALTDGGAAALIFMDIFS